MQGKLKVKSKKVGLSFELWTIPGYCALPLALRWTSIDLYKLDGIQKNCGWAVSLHVLFFNFGLVYDGRLK